MPRKPRSQPRAHPAHDPALSLDGKNGDPMRYLTVLSQVTGRLVALPRHRRLRSTRPITSRVSRAALLRLAPIRVRPNAAGLPLAE